MKTLRLLIITFLSTSLLLLNSCEKVKDVADIKFDATIETNIDVTSTQGEMRDGSYSFEGEGTIDPTEDETINEYWNVIKEWSIKKVIISINKIDKETTLTEGSIVIEDVDNNNDVLFHKNFQKMILSNGKKVLEVSESEWNAMVNALDQKHKIYAHIVGAVDQPDVNIEFGVKIFVHVVANPL